MGFYLDKLIDKIDYALSTDSITREIDRAHNYSLRNPGKPPIKLSARAEARLYNQQTDSLAYGMISKYNKQNVNNRPNESGTIVGHWSTYMMSLCNTNKKQLTEAANIAAKKVGGTVAVSEDKGARIGVSGLGRADDDYDFYITSDVYAIKGGNTSPPATKTQSAQAFNPIYMFLDFFSWLFSQPSATNQNARKSGSSVISIRFDD